MKWSNDAIEPLLMTLGKIDLPRNKDYDLETVPKGFE